MLDLYGCYEVKGTVADLAPLTKLTKLDLTYCSWLKGTVSDLAPLIKLSESDKAKVIEEMQEEEY